MMEFRRGNLERARELLQQGVWANSGSRDVAYVWQVNLSVVQDARPPVESQQR